MLFVVEYSMFTNVKNIYLRYFFSKSVALLKISFYFCKTFIKTFVKAEKYFQPQLKNRRKLW